MENQSNTPKNKHHELRFPKTIFSILIVMSVLIITIMQYSFKIGYKMSAEVSPLVDAAMEIKLEATTAHLWFKEIISGDRTENIENVIMHIDNAIWYATAMLEGGKNPEGVFVPLADPIMRNGIIEVREEIKIFKKITKERYATIKESGIGTPIDQKYDAIFSDFLEKADFVETKLQESIAFNLKKYRYLQSFLFLFLFSSISVILFAFYKYEAKKITHLNLIHQANSDIKVLKGFIPICASCKNIRDDNGYWNQIESYIKEHSEAEFSHGVCPDCAKKLYPDLVDKIEF